MEASDLMQIAHLTYDQAIKKKLTKPRSKHCTGPFFQLISYDFGQFKMLVRYEADCADFAAGNMYVSTSYSEIFLIVNIKWP
jgi:hypothetical protein